jgi:hypothetical protein
MMSNDMDSKDVKNNGETLETMDVLHKLEQGEIDVEEAERLLMDQGPSVEKSADQPDTEDSLQTRSWWLILFAIGFGFLVFGWGVATLGGWWWLCAGPLLLLGAVLAALGVGTMHSPWVHLRIFEQKGRRAHRFSIRLPLPTRFAAWGLRNFGHYAAGLDRTGVDEILLALDELENNLAQGPPILIDITDGDNGEQVEVTLG